MSKFVDRSKSLLDIVRSHPLALPTWIADRFIERYFDWKFGIVSSERRSADQLGLKPNCADYQPMSYWDFWKCMKAVPFDPRDHGFLDYGSGMGRVVCLAAMYPFRLVTGVEISPELNEIARRNVEHSRTRHRCRGVRIVPDDETQHTVPSEVTVCFMFHPFDGDVLVRSPRPDR